MSANTDLTVQLVLFLLEQTCLLRERRIINLNVPMFGSLIRQAGEMLIDIKLIWWILMIDHVS